jgi:DnaJ-class molecular chaperone
MSRCNNLQSTCALCGGTGQFIEREQYRDRTCSECNGKKSIQSTCLECSGIGLLAAGHIPLDVETAMLPFLRLKLSLR